MRKLTLFFAALCCSATLIAETVNYPLSIAGVQVNSDNCENLVEALANADPSLVFGADAQASYDPATGTLHLNEFSLESTGQFSIAIGASIIFDIKGKCEINALTGTITTSDIEADQTVTFTGGGSFIFSTSASNPLLGLKEVDLIIDDVELWVIGKVNYYSVEAKTITLNKVKPVLPNPYAVNTEYGSAIVVQKDCDVLSTSNKEVRFINYTPVNDTIKVEHADPSYTMYYVVTDDHNRQVALAPKNASEPFYATYPSGNVVIPDSVTDEFGKKYAVRKINANALSNCENISSLTFEATDMIDLPNEPIMANTPIDTLDVSRLHFQDYLISNAMKDNQINWFTGKDEHNWFAGIDGVLCYVFYYYRADKSIQIYAVGGARTTDIVFPTDVKVITFPSVFFKTIKNELDMYLPSKDIRLVYNYEPNDHKLKHLYVPCQVEDTFKTADFGPTELVGLLDVDYNVTLNATNGTLATDTTGCNEIKVTATPASGYVFSKWSDDETENPRTFALASDTAITALFVASSPTELEQVSLNSVEVRDGRVYCEGEFRIYDMLGRDVTRMNGKLNGVYVVRVDEKSQKVVVR